MLAAVGGGAAGWVGSNVSAVVSSLWPTRLRVPAGAVAVGAADAVLMGAALVGGVQPGGGSNALFGLAGRVAAATTGIGIGADTGADATSAAGGGAAGTVEAVPMGAALVGGVHPGGGSNALFGLAGRVAAATTGIGAGIGAGATSAAGGGGAAAATEAEGVGSGVDGNKVLAVEIESDVLRVRDVGTG